MNFSDVRDLQKLAVKTGVEIEKSKRAINRNIHRISKHGTEGKRASSVVSNDMNKLLKFAETHNKEEIKIEADKFLTKWQ